MFARFDRALPPVIWFIVLLAIEIMVVALLGWPASVPIEMS